MNQKLLNKILNAFGKHVRSMTPEQFKAELDKLKDDPLTKTIQYALEGKIPKKPKKIKKKTANKKLKNKLPQWFADDINDMYDHWDWRRE